MKAALGVDLDRRSYTQPIRNQFSRASGTTLGRGRRPDKPSRPTAHDRPSGAFDHQITCSSAPFAAGAPPGMSAAYPLSGRSPGVHPVVNSARLEGQRLRDAASRPPCGKVARTG